MRSSSDLVKVTQLALTSNTGIGGRAWGKLRTGASLTLAQLVQKETGFEMSRENFLGSGCLSGKHMTQE